MLERVVLISNLNEREITKLQAIGRKRSVPKNTMVISEGDDADSLYVVIKGKAHALRSDESGRQLIVNSFGPYGRLTRVLIEKQNADGVIEEKLTEQEFADMVGSSRETVNRIFNELVSGGYLAKVRGRIKLLKKLPCSF